MRASPYVAEAVVFGHGRKYLTAVIEIDFDTVADWARANDVAYTGFTSLTAHPRIERLIRVEIDRVNGELARVEQIKSFRILPKALDPEEEGEPVTPTRKVKRNLMYERFKDADRGNVRRQRGTPDRRQHRRCAEHAMTHNRNNENGRETMFKRTLLGALAAFALALPAAAQDAYVVGITAALTGPPSSTYAPAVDALRIYIDRVNAAGGVNGKQIKLVIEDDGAQPSKAAANTKKLITQDNVVLMVNASLSSTYAPVIAETKSANVPLLFASGVCPPSVYPPAAALEFCTTGYAAHYDSQATLDFIKGMAKGAVKIGFSAMAIPLSRGEMDYAMELSKKVGMNPVDEEVIPPPTADYTPFATKLKDAGPELGLFLGAVGDAGAHAGSAAQAWLAGRLHCLGPSRGGGRARAA